ncbi:excalibur calcium-binding domain-containing protein [Mameliella alba]|nr:excalibur calcium-binding domain-containing protein [Mameliella sediminis]MBY6114379.1 excalibur calcium-binding domain-containing protein [Antarctobacter heliothermus]MBY6143952.1 excalibur calcium-binding domain-containing protein [Mameliella alba]MBY6163388.1 excalibur calcium-binding domain-containing protein [Mameliella alba]MBY6171651.1 excalibur calcium-binding domain-containing protein [Mameliella alba]
MERLDQFRTAQAFDCRNVSCKRLRSCAEACYKLLQCGQSKRDGDKDGIPCENLCKRRC